MEEAALGLGLAGLPCCLLAELGTFYFIFSVGGDRGRQVQGLESETGQARAYFGSLESLLVKVTSFCS